MLDYTADNLNDRDIPFYMIESVNQLQYNQQDGMYDLAGLVHYRTARVYAMAKEELEKITPEEAAMRYYISDLERNARVNLYPLYKKPLHGMNLTQTNLSYVKMVSQKLTDRGYTLGKASIMPPYYPNRLLLAITAAAAACGFVFVLNLLIPLSDRKNYILMAIGIVCAVIGAVVAKGALFLQVWAIGCATAAPTAAILLALDHWKKKKITRKLGYGRVVRDGTIGLFFAVAVAMIGGLYIAAMLGNIRFFMEFDFYRGVKLTFVLPLLLVAIGYLRRFPLMGQTIASPEDLKVFVKDFLNIPIKMGTILILAVLAWRASSSSAAAVTRPASPYRAWKWPCAVSWKMSSMPVRGKRNFSSAIRLSTSWSLPCTVNGRSCCTSSWSSPLPSASAPWSKPSPISGRPSSCPSSAASTAG